MLALIDADIVTYRCAATAEEEPEWIAVARTRDLIEQILGDVDAKSYKLYLTGGNNFRKKIYPEYKANREGRPVPKHLNACRLYTSKEWGAEVTDGYEADDALGMSQTGESVICSIDKDLLQIPGKHWNFVKREYQEISVERGLREFYTQLLIGDQSDNIKGCPGIGKAKAPRILEGCDTEEDMFEACRITYEDDTLMELNGKLLWVWRKPNDIWQFNRATNTKQEPEVLLESTQATEEESIQFMAHGLTK
jgi:5'-3' exonuclease